MDQPQRTLVKEANGDGNGKGRTGRSKSKGQKKKNRSRSNSRGSSSSSSSSSSRSSSSGHSRSGKDKSRKTGNQDKSKSKNNTPKKLPSGAPYKEELNVQRTGQQDNALKNDKSKKSVNDSNNTNNAKNDKKQVKENGARINSNNNHNNTNNHTNRNDTTAEIYSRPRTSHPRLEGKGYDNSERNPNRRNLGSSTDHVADQRPIFGPWRAPDPERQRLLVERLAPARPPAPPDPRFNHWRNHFLYYWNIGCDPKPRRQGIYSANASPQRQQYSEAGHTGAQNGRDNRLLKRRPKTSSARLGRDNRKTKNGDNNSSSSNNYNNNNNNMRLDLTNHPFTGSASVDGRHGMARRGTQSAREYSAGECPTIVSGLDRRYMGLQSVSGPQMQQIVDRLTKMTSAYNAKFAPNPHVWVDTEPGAHMVKRSNTTVG